MLSFLFLGKAMYVHDFFGGFIVIAGLFVILVAKQSEFTHKRVSLPVAGGAHEEQGSSATGGSDKGLDLPPPGTGEWASSGASHNTRALTA